MSQTQTIIPIIQNKNEDVLKIMIHIALTLSYQTCNVFSNIAIAGQVYIEECVVNYVYNTG